MMNLKTQIKTQNVELEQMAQFQGKKYAVIPPIESVNHQ
jgi:hypothetical protein